MNNATAHLPIGIRPGSKIGPYELPVAVDLISSMDNTLSVYAINNLGSKKFPQEVIDVNIDFLKSLGIEPDLIWQDSTIENIQMVCKIIRRGLAEGFIYIREASVYTSRDGSVEFLEVEENLNSGINERREIQYYVKDGKAYLKETGEELNIENRNCLLLRLPDKKYDICTTPEYGQLELQAMINFYRGKELLISRVAPKDLAIDIGKEYFNIDTDILWLPFLTLVEILHNIHVDKLVTVHRTVKQIALSIMINDLLGTQLPSQIIVLPRVSLDRPKGDELHKAECFLQTYGPIVTKLFLMSGVGSKRKEVVFPSSLAHWINISLTEANIAALPLPNDTPTLLDFYKEGGAISTIPQVLKKIRQQNFDDIMNLYKWLILKACEE